MAHRISYLSLLVGLLLWSSLAAAQNQAPQFGGVTGVENTGTGFSLLVRWNAASDPDGDAVRYRVFVSTEPGQFKFGGPHIVTDQLQATIEGLTPGMTYYVVVRAIDAQGNEETNFEILSGKPDAGPYSTGTAGCQLQRGTQPGIPTATWVLLVLLAGLALRALRTSATTRR